MLKQHRVDPTHLRKLCSERRKLSTSFKDSENPPRFINCCVRNIQQTPWLDMSLSALLLDLQNKNYQFKMMALEAKRRRPPHLDRGTYVGPVAVRQTESHGRGLFTTASVKAGDLLLCEKAFSYAFHSENDNSTGLTFLINPDTENITVGTHAELIGLIVRRLYKNPSHQGNQNHEPSNVYFSKLKRRTQDQLMKFLAIKYGSHT